MKAFETAATINKLRRKSLATFDDSGCIMNAGRRCQVRLDLSSQNGNPMQREADF
jgi:hypothetical protein